MEINYRTIGQRCVMTTKKGKQCRLPACTIAGGLAVCPYHIKEAVRLYREVLASNPNDQAVIKAGRESEYI